MTRSRTIDAEAAVAGDMPRANHLATASPSDLAEFYTLVKARGPICSVRLILDRLTPEQSDKFRAAMATKSIPATIIAKVVTGWLPEGEVLRHDPVRRHRDGQCACPT